MARDVGFTPTFKFHTRNLLLVKLTSYFFIRVSRGIIRINKQVVSELDLTTWNLSTHLKPTGSHTRWARTITGFEHPLDYDLCRHEAQPTILF
jgi:hypothetical protein